MDEPKILEHLWDTTPLTVFGLLTTLLVVANYFQWRRNQQLTDIIIVSNDRYADAAINFTVLVRQTLEAVQEMKDKMLTKFLDNEEDNRLTRKG